MTAEVKIHDRWEAVGRVFEHGYHNPKRPTLIYAYPDERDWESNARLTERPYDDRNYRLFSILADVRNYLGIKPISEPRGLPSDVSQYVKNLSDDMGYDGHSHSWLTLAELESYDWDAPIRDSGWVGAGEYRTFKKNGRPNSWSRGVWGANVVHVSNEEMDNLPGDGRSYYTKVEWSWPIREATDDFLNGTLPALRGLLDWEGVQDVRIVFFFDN